LCGQQFVFLDLANKNSDNGGDVVVERDDGLLKRSTGSYSRTVST
jgi:hypothetical protein